MEEKVVSLLKFLKKEEEKARGGFIQYLKIKGEIKEVKEEIEYIETLITKAQELPISTLMDLREDLRMLNSEIKRLNDKKEEFETVMDEKFRKWNKTVEGYRNLLKEVENEVSEEKIETLIEKKEIQNFKSTMTEVKRALKKLNEYLSIVSDWVKDEEYPLLNKAKEEVKKVKRLKENLQRVSFPTSIDMEKINEAWRFIGNPIFNKQEKEVGFVSDVYLNIETFKVILEVKKEKLLSENVLRSIFEVIGEAYGKKSFRSFEEDISKEIKEHSHMRLTPTNLQMILEEKNIRGESISKLLSPDFKVAGYISYEKLQRSGNKLKIKGKIKGENIEKRKPYFLPLPCTHNLKDYVGKEKKIQDFNYSLRFQYFFPEEGYSFLLLRKDEERGYLPSKRVVKKILATLREREEILKDIGIKIRDEIEDPEEAIWRLKMAVINGLPSKDISERKSLRPRWLFLFCIKFGIPILFTELLQSYFDLIQSSKIQQPEEAIKPKIFENIETKEFTGLLPKKCEEILGFHPTNELKIRCTEKKNKEELIDTLKRSEEQKEKPTKNIEDILSMSHNNRRLIQILLLTRQIRTVSDYREILNHLGKKDINYSRIEEKLVKDIENRIYKKAISAVMKRKNQ